MKIGQLLDPIFAKLHAERKPTPNMPIKQKLLHHFELSGTDDGPDFRDEMNNWRVDNLSIEGPGIGSLILVLVFHTVFWWIILYMIETSVFTRWCNSMRPPKYISK